MRLNLVMTQNQGAPRQQVTTEEREHTIAQFESQFYELSTPLKERLLITTDERFANKMNELAYYATNGSIYIT